MGYNVYLGQTNYWVGWQDAYDSNTKYLPQFHGGRKHNGMWMRFGIVGKLGKFTLILIANMFGMKIFMPFLPFFIF